MNDDTLENLPEKPSGSLDLNSLSSLDFGPSWAGEESRKTSSNRYKSHEGGRGGSASKKRGGGSRDRRPDRPRRDTSGGSQEARSGNDASFNARGRQRGSGAKRGRDDRHRSTFDPTVKIDIYPQDEAFDVLVKRLQSTARTYQLFEITKLLLEKNERFIVVVTPKDKAKGANAQELFYSVPGHLPFETEDAAINYVLNHHLEQFFETEIVEVEAPKGNFQMVNRCPFTGELLGPPNYHRYSEFLQRHFANRVNGISFDRYQEKIESVKEQESIDAWVESMKQSTRYTVKEPVEGEPTVLENFEAARLFLLQYRKSAIVGSGESVRFAGRDIERLPAGDIRRSVECFVEDQRYFPLETANNIRGRLRRHNFTIYKKGAKSTSFVCAVKRKFRDPGSVFTDSIQGLIDFIEKNPEVKASELSKRYLGIEVPTNKPVKLKLAEPEAVTESDATEDGTSEAVETTVEAPAEVEAVEPANAELPEAATEETPVASETENKLNDPVLTEAETEAFKQLKLDLRWLVTEGYVTEYGDGRLFAPSAMPPVKPKAKKVPTGEGTEVSKTSVDTAPSEEESSTPVSESTEVNAEATEAPPETTEASAEAIDASAEVGAEPEADGDLAPDSEEADADDAAKPATSSEAPNA